MKAVTKAEVRARIDHQGFSGGSILLDGENIGRFVTYGGGRLRGNIGSMTIYGSRIYRAGLSIEVEGASLRVMLDKVAAAIARAMKQGKWQSPKSEPKQI